MIGAKSLATPSKRPGRGVIDGGTAGGGGAGTTAVGRFTTIGTGGLLSPETVETSLFCRRTLATLYFVQAVATHGS